jgi:hypothetical protein
MGVSRQSAHHRRTRWIRAFVIGVGAVALLGACTSDGAPLFPQATTGPRAGTRSTRTRSTRTRAARTRAARARATGG